jgi:uncharacterized membrane protein YqhA
MRRLLELSRYSALLGVLSLLAAGVTAFAWGTAKTVHVVGKVLASHGADPTIAVQMIALLDAFLIALALLFFAVSLYELFIGELNVPPWLIAHGVHDLKVKLSSVVVLVMAVSFAEHLVEWRDPQGTALFALAVALVSSVLIAFCRFGEKA